MHHLFMQNGGWLHKKLFLLLNLHASIMVMTRPVFFVLISFTRLVTTHSNKIPKIVENSQTFFVWDKKLTIYEMLKRGGQQNKPT